MKYRRAWIWLGAFVLVIAAFWLLNFRAAVTGNETQKLVMHTDMGVNMPAAMQRRDPISLVMVGEGPLARALQKELTKKVQEAGLGEVRLEQEMQPRFQNPVLIVKVIKPGPLWTPVFATGSFSVHAGYDSGGDTTFMQAVEETHTSVGKPDAANMYAEYDVRDRSLGLISRPGYYQYLAEYLADEIVAALREVYNI